MTEAEFEALQLAEKVVLATAIDDKGGRDHLGRMIPGKAIFKRLEKQGLIFFTEEDEPWTPMIYLTDQGRDALIRARSSSHLEPKK